ncbi:MAG TPA: hypothetical protein VF134_07280 [Candidatus Dormibacteraeota bacterium]
MRKILLAAGALLASISISCGGGQAATTPTPAAAPACVNASAPHKAYVVVTHLDGKTVQKCVGFTGDQIGAEDLMNKSGIEYQSQTFSFGKAVCQVDNDPAQFTQCFTQGQPYWLLFTETAGGPWTMAQTGYTAVNVPDGGGLGWRMSPPNASPAPTPAAVKK